jgi:hypothetical protein
MKLPGVFLWPMLITVLLPVGSSLQTMLANPDDHDGSLLPVVLINRITLLL